MWVTLLRPVGGSDANVCNVLRGVHAVWLISVLRFWISQGSTLNFKGWNSHVHREFPVNLASINLSGDNLSREIGRSSRRRWDCPRQEQFVWERDDECFVMGSAPPPRESTHDFSCLSKSIHNPSPNPSQIYSNQISHAIPFYEHNANTNATIIHIQCFVMARPAPPSLPRHLSLSAKPRRARKEGQWVLSTPLHTRALVFLCSAWF